MSWRLRFTADSFRGLRHALLEHSPLEAGAILLCNRGGDRQLIVAEIRIADSGDYTVQTPSSLEFTPSFLASAVKAARQRQQALILVHTHPFSDEPEFSSVDDRGEGQLIPAISSRAPAGPHGALVLGRTGFQARVYEQSISVAVSEIIEVGSRVVSHALQHEDNAISEIFNRNVLAFGDAGQRVLGRLRVGIVGLGGTGSLVAEQLAYLGVRDFILIDDDQIEATNLNRVVGASPSDVGRDKIDCASDNILRISGDAATVSRRLGNVVDQVVGEHLLACDAVFGCTDTHASRALINQLAYQYLVPAVDMGVGIDSVEGTVIGMAGRVQMLAPGLACLQCQNTLDPEQVRRGLLTDEARRADPYIVGTPVPQPSVISLNATVASLAVSTFLAGWVGFPIRARRMNYLIAQGQVRAVSGAPNPSCVVCSSSAALGKGTSWPMFWRGA